VVAVAAQVRVEEADVVETLRTRLVGFEEHDRPVVGDTAVVRLTVPEKPSRAVTVKVDDPLLPEKTVTAVGLATTVKSCTVYVTVTV
jgi:hypothetical protein